ncbi:hypothetical protein L3Q82_021062 [Scortum barcoo]|uniref:Uncharacterized protein n=1 Tax=Scortum barcoo TaxID=214431 RepID=A0ACB8X4N2_9TELE|nr:hypothetical protein L3Q82_021062 [Scortum barcoo]
MMLSCWLHQARTFSMYVLERFAAECEVWVERSCLKVEEFKYLGVLFTSEGKMEREIDRRIGAASMQLCGRCTGPSW